MNGVNNNILDVGGNVEGDINQVINLSPSFADYIDNLKEPELSEEISHLDYRSKKIPFIGRDADLLEIQKFLDDDKSLAWWAVIGPGGTGKSRLVFEFVKKKKDNSDWKMLFLPDSFFRLPSGSAGWEPWCDWGYDKNLLLIVDYVRRFSDTVAQFITVLATSKTLQHKIRILLIDREVDEKALWYTWQFDTPVLKGSQYADFYNLGYLSDKKLGELSVNYISKRYQKNLDESELSTILSHLIEIDPTKRILYLLMILDAWVENPDQWRNWNKIELANYIVKREIKNINDRFVEVEPEAKKAYKRLLCFATMTGGLDIAHLPEGFSDALKNDYLTLKISCESRSQLCALIQSTQLVIQPYTPDILGEYLALKLFDESFWDEIERNQIIQSAYQIASLNFFYFLDRCLQDYMNQVRDFSDLFSFEVFLQTPLYLNAKLSYASFLVDLSMTQKVAEATVTANRLEGLYQAHPENEEIAVVFANCLFKLSTKQEVTEAMVTADRLEGLYQAHPENEEIAFQFAGCLNNLAYKQEVAEATVIADRLEGLSQDHPENKEIALDFAMGLVYLSYKQEVAEATVTADRLEGLYQAHPGNKEIALAVAKGLVDLSAKLEEVGATTEL